MGSKAKVVTLADVTSRIGDGLHGTPIYDGNGEYFFINGNNLSNGKIIFTDTTKKTNTEQYSKHKKELNDRTILLSINGTLGNLAFYNNEKVVLGKSACYLNILPDVNKDYIYYVLSSKNFKNYITNLATGSTIKNVGLKLVREFSFELPSKEIQDSTSNILRSLDNKIYLNTQINQTLENIAQAIFKSWFVDFDPVRAKIVVLENGGTPAEAELAAMRKISAKSDQELAQFKLDKPEEYAQLAHTASLFPSKMQDSELGEIPEGWEVKTIGDTHNLIMGQSPKGETYNECHEGIIFFQGRAEFDWRYPKPRLYTTDPKKVAPKGYVLMSVRAPVGDLNIAQEKCCIGRGLCAILHKSESTSFTYYLFKSLSAKFLSFNSEGTVFGSINQNNLKSIRYIEPSSSLIERFIQTISDLDMKIYNYSINSITLEFMRAILLRKLILNE